jgi:hypothetical protein
MGDFEAPPGGLSVVVDCDQYKKNNQSTSNPGLEF